jgi:hypothetical protein
VLVAVRSKMARAPLVFLPLVALLQLLMWTSLVG